jgi:AcrR family transcriptional regulator
MPQGLTKRRPVTVNALLDAAMDLFAEQGFGATSIPEICARAGLTKGAFYSNFKTKDALFLVLLDRSWDRRAAWIRSSLPPRDLVEGTPQPAEHEFDRARERQWTLVSTEFSLYAIRRPAVATLLVAHESRARAELAALLVEALDRADRVAIIPELELARMVVAISEGNDIQALTDAAAGGASHAELGRTAVAALVHHFSRPRESIIK